MRGDSTIGDRGGRSPVALDGMGGDRAPQVTIEGALKAAAQGAHIIVTGPAGELRSSMEAQSKSLGIDLGACTGSIEIVDAPEVVTMDDEPAKAVRSRPASSIAVACSLVTEGAATALVSAGSTGAAVAGAVLKFGRIRGIARPGIATVIPFPAHPIVLIDSGANAECQPQHFVDFALMGAVFADTALGRHPARVGLLNIGAEEGKGAALHREAFRLIKAAASTGAYPFEFVGNVEGYDLPHAAADVVVTDGFTGNVVLKLSEGIARSLIQEIVGAISAKTSGDVQREAVGALLDLRQRVNADGMGGACLLGVRSVAVIAHGSSNGDSICKAILFAGSDKASLVQRHITAAMAESRGRDAV
jgi:glycerol-3-phosphate acyltransferase PlsX